MSGLSTSASPTAPAGQVPEEALARRPSLGGWAALLVVYVVWGSTYLAIRVGVETIPPLLLAGARYLIAGLILFPFAIRSGSAANRAADHPSRANWLACAVVGILLLLGGNGLVSVGERTVPSGFASLLVAIVPLWLLVLGAALSRRWIGWLPLAGLIVGLAGVALLAGLGDGASANGASAGGILIVLVASLSWALGTIASTRLALPQRAPLATAMQMLTGGVTILGPVRGDGGVQLVPHLPRSAAVLAGAGLPHRARLDPRPVRLQRRGPPPLDVDRGHLPLREPGGRRPLREPGGRRHPWRDAAERATHARLADRRCPHCRGRRPRRLAPR